MSMIEVTNLGKKYRIGSQERYLSMRDFLVETFSFAGKKNRTVQNMTDFWALQDISFSVEQGEVLGIIGRNGAGKSTLLKLLSQITPPTTGQITLRGRVGSLLEVGTGFHPELTGRENVYLNGAILGMRKKEIDRKFDDIVEFSGVSKFLDTPVKRYSSGMYVRLAFSVAAHLEPEILIVDEVLAVGDAEFQKKCLGKMEEVTKQNGRTILFVSHNMGAIQKLCGTCLWLDGGKLIAQGKTQDVVDKYMSGNAQQSHISLIDRMDRKGNGKIRFKEIHFEDMSGNECSYLRAGEPVRIVCTYDLTDPTIKEFNFGFSIDTFFDQNRIAFIGNKVVESRVSTSKKKFIITIDKLPLNIGKYQFTVIAFDQTNDIFDWVQKAGEFDVEFGDFYGNKQLPGLNDGFLLIDYQVSQ